MQRDRARCVRLGEEGWRWAGGVTAARPMYHSFSAWLCAFLHQLSAVRNRSTSSCSCRRPPMLVPFAGLQALPLMHRELGADSVVGGKGRPIRRQRTRCTPHLAVIAFASACTTACGNVHTASSQRLRAIDRELGASRVVGGVARRWRRRRPILAPMHAAPMLCSPMRLPAPPFSNVPRAIHRELGASRVVGGVAGRWQRRRRPIPTNQASAYACAFCWFASATCDASGARGEFCRRRGRTADATAARPT